ncbi:hypothetical protein V5O48_001833 [Marasmius crinis-equi]|uniref:Uncharacterized protein n=1 Tax=Marasmius crinis-equi TaxID=585013 RepID=A0ABR3FXE8_9AGAR
MKLSGVDHFASLRQCFDNKHDGLNYAPLRAQVSKLIGRKDCLKVEGVLGMFKDEDSDDRDFDQTLLCAAGSSRSSRSIRTPPMGSGYAYPHAYSDHLSAKPSLNGTENFCELGELQTGESRYVGLRREAVSTRDCGGFATFLHLDFYMQYGLDVIYLTLTPNIHRDFTPPAIHLPHLRSAARRSHTSKNEKSGFGIDSTGSQTDWEAKETFQSSLKAETVTLKIEAEL